MANAGLDSLLKLITATAVDKLSERVATEISSVEASIPTKVSQITNDKGYQTAEDIRTAIGAQIGKVFRPRGSVLFSELPEPSESVLGDVYDIKENFITTANFREGSGKKFPAGTNVTIVQDGEDYKYDVLSGEIDLSGYVEKETGKGLSSNDYTDDDVTKLGGIATGATKVEASATDGNIKINGVETPIVTIATDAEIDEIISKHFPAQPI